MRVRPLPLLAASAALLTLLAGCSDSPDPPVPPSPEPQAAAWSASPGAVAIAKCRFANCYEPSIAADPLGRLFVVDGVTGGVAVSEDGGTTWEARAAPPLPAGVGNGLQSDVIVQAAPGGRLYWSALVLVGTPVGSAVLEGIQVAWSDDGARTWAGSAHVAPATGTPQVVYPDRQWLGFAPDGTMYVTYNQIPTGIWLARSDDGGATWSGWTRAASVEGRNGGIGQSGPPVVAADGAVLVPACEGAANAEGSPGTFVFRSTDRGATFEPTLVDAPCSWFPIAAVAPDGAVVLADQPGGVQVAWSTDGGRTFEGPRQWGEGSTTAGVWPLALGDGRLVAAWYEAEGTLHLTRGTLADGPQETLTPGEATGEGSARTRARTDFASAALLPDGRVATVWVEGNKALVSVTNAV